MRKEFPETLSTDLKQCARAASVWGESRSAGKAMLKLHEFVYFHHFILLYTP